MKLHLFHILYLVLYPAASAILTNCEFYEDGIVLHCFNLFDFPKGSFYNVETINFSNNNFTQLNRNVFYNRGFRNLQKAILRSNHITQIQPKTFASMSSISHLDLSENELTKFTKNTFNGLTTLKILNLGNNRIVSIQPDILEPLTYLDFLDLYNNSITNLPVDLLKYGSVTQLDISDNFLVVPERGPILQSSFLIQLFLRSCNLQKLPQEAFSELRELQILDLSKNKLKVIPAGSLKGLTKLKYLDISYNFIAHLEDFFPPFVSLKQFSCEGNILQADKCKSLLATTTGKVSNFTKAPVINDLGKDDENSSTEFDDISIHSKSNAEDIVLGLIAIVVLVCVVLLSTLGCQVYYIIFSKPRVEGHVYEEIQYSEVLHTWKQKLLCVQVQS